MALEFSWQMPFCSPVPTPGQWIQLAQAVEYAGIDGLWIPGGAPCADSLGVAAALCAHTRHVQLTVSVPAEVMLPAALASTLQSLQSISANRIRLHLPDSEQHSLRKTFGEWLNRDQRSERIGEYLEILERLLSPNEGGFNYSGRYFQLENAGFAKRPLPAPPLILDGSQNAALIAAHAHLCLLPSAPPGWLEQEISRLREGSTGRLGFASSFGLIQGDSEEQAWDAAARQLAADVQAQPCGAPMRRLTRNRHPLRQFEIHPNLLQLRPGQPLYLVGTAQQIATRLQELHGVGIEQIIIQDQPAVSEVLRFGERILPLLHGQGLRKEGQRHGQ
ncbi:LLM class flavin-dependent oxidoreductase [Pseudomonas putida]|mgnify:CR=1 FL=1|uniref:LLM class flavin-dependent oxidoreductase n=1 Tax=Pseudomonas putida TaxID=303 RepID=A0A7W2QIV3_PSEPU|nr:MULTISPECIES: LLM class flavin-dependent oxidoreductase [Pseudomonas]MBA6116233.1 LLM class flavin-dependent oxidoreductase [Pseudomonas putida]MBI6942745.1 LLM class flavin-dependent oxidoreductase [Pseudomonas putida]MBI6958792.1 LLM class flavin-dependent oxidoreductase [Pseudomonas putida]MCZ9639114.1 LLM class flavin-dependent oxidoreductase [Pseudomonas putida]PZQ40195.1 MAG: LLM class flavin-dependent oxidoreductase [Pseudomonas putida]